MKNEDFQKLKDTTEQELKITPENAMDKSIQLSNLYISFLKIHSKEKRVYEVKKLEKEKIYGELYHWYKFPVPNKTGDKFDFQLGSISEIDIYIKSNPQYHQLALECTQLEVQLNFIEQTLQHINNLGFKIKNYIDLLKISKGFSM
jgi:hypothetical protein